MAGPSDRHIRNLTFNFDDELQESNIVYFNYNSFFTLYATGTFTTNGIQLQFSNDGESTWIDHPDGLFSAEAVVTVFNASQGTAWKAVSVSSFAGDVVVSGVQ